MLNFINLLTASVTMPGGTNEVATQAANAVSEVATEATSAASIFGLQMGKAQKAQALLITLLCSSCPLFSISLLLDPQ